MTEGRKLTDKELEKLEKKLAKEYRTAKKEMQKKLDKFQKKFDAADKVQKGLLDKGAITKKQYQDWRMGQIARSQWMQDQIKSYADDLVHVNQRAAEAINGTLPKVFAESHNFGTYEAEKAARIGTNYTLYNRDTVARLLKDDPKLLPKASIDVAKDKKWNVQKLNSALTQGIMQGESVDKIAKRLQNVTDMDRASAIKNARTMVTGAENAGKLESYRRAAAMGIKLKKMWSATIDDRTRDSHAFLDGVTVDLEEEFPNKCMYPGDPGGPGDEVWNCRCELSMQLDGFERDITDLENRNTDHFNYDSYDEWKSAHGEFKVVDGKWVKSSYQKTMSTQELLKRVEALPVKFDEVDNLIKVVDDDIARASAKAFNELREKGTDKLSDYAIEAHTFAEIETRQKWLDAEKLADIVKSGKLDELSSITNNEKIRAIRYKGHIILIDGNHRANLLKLRGDKKIVLLIRTVG